MTKKPKEQAERDKILTGNVWRLMVTMSLPAIIAMSINGINTFVDGLFVGQYIGQDALAAVSLVLPLTMITNGFSSLIGMGAASLLSISIGNKNEDIQKSVFGTVSLLSVSCSIILTLLGWYFAPQLLALMGAEGNIQSLGVIYYRIMMIGAFFRIYSVALNMLIRAEGKVAEAMVYSIMATVLNIILNYVFVAVLGIGVAGAAWSTVIAMIIYTVLNLWYFCVAKKASFSISFSNYSLESKFLKPIFAVGISAMLMQIMFFVQQAVVFRSVAHYGGDWDITFMGASLRIFLLVIIPGYGFAQALQPIIGINYGASNYSRVKKAFNVFVIAYTAFLVLIWLWVILFPNKTMGWMIPDVVFADGDIWNYWILMSCLPLYPYFLMSTTLFQAIGRGKIASWVLIAREIVLFIPVVLVLPLWYSIRGVYASWLPVNLIVFVISVYLIRKIFSDWKKVEPVV